MGTSREGVFGDAVDAGPEASPGNEAPQVAVPEGESDDEYEQIPSKSSRQLKRAEPTVAGGSLAATKPQAAANAAARQSEAGDDSRGGDKGTEGETVAEGEETHHEHITTDETQEPVATDDDWLRTRTNRLLDLMDPEDIAPGPAGGESAGNDNGARPAPDTGDATEPSESPGDTPTRDDVVGDTEGEGGAGDAAGPSGDDAAEAIRQTRRLFVRNLPYGAAEDDIRAWFERFGTVQEVR